MTYNQKVTENKRLRAALKGATDFVQATLEDACNNSCDSGEHSHECLRDKKRLASWKSLLNRSKTDRWK